MVEPRWSSPNDFVNKTEPVKRFGLWKKVVKWYIIIPRLSFMMHPCDHHLFCWQLGGRHPRWQKFQLDWCIGPWMELSRTVKPNTTPCHGSSRVRTRFFSISLKLCSSQYSSPVKCRPWIWSLVVLEFCSYLSQTFFSPWSSLLLNCFLSSEFIHF